MIDICFVCTGGTCRSVMAERIAKKLAKKKNIKDIRFASAGIYSNGEPISENSCLALKSLGYDGRTKKSCKLTKPKSNCIYIAVTDSHKKKINSKKVMSFGELAEEIDDPYGQSLEVYIKTAQKIEKNIEVLLDKIEKMRGVL